MKMMQKTVLALIVLVPSLAASAESVDVHVRGTITPVACTPMLSGGGVVDYGAILPATLSPTAFTVLDVKQIDLSITCDAPAKVAIVATNGRPGTLPLGSVEGISGWGNIPAGISIFGLSAGVAVAGLGLDGTARIGGYGLRLAPETVQADGSAVENILRSNDSTGTVGPWLASPNGLLASYSNIRHTSWSAVGDTTRTPLSFESFSGKLEVQAYLNKASDLDLSKPVVMDGQTTIDLVYL